MASQIHQSLNESVWAPATIPPSRSRPRLMYIGVTVDRENAISSEIRSRFPPTLPTRRSANIETPCDPTKPMTPTRCSNTHQRVMAPEHSGRRGQISRSHSAAVERPGKAGRAAVAVSRDLTAGVRPHLDPAASSRRWVSGLPSSASARRGPSARTFGPIVGNSSGGTSTRRIPRASSNWTSLTGSSGEKATTRSSSSGEISDIRCRQSSGPVWWGRSNATTLGARQELAQLRDAGAVRAVADPGQERPFVQPEQVAAFGRRRRLQSARDRDPELRQIRGERLRLRTAPLLTRTQQDRAGVGEQQGVVRVDRVGITRDRSATEDHLGPAARQLLAKGRVLLGDPARVGLTVPAIRGPRAQVGRLRSSHVDTAERSSSGLDRHGWRFSPTAEPCGRLSGRGCAARA